MSSYDLEWGALCLRQGLALEAAAEDVVETAAFFSGDPASAASLEESVMKEAALRDEDRLLLRLS